MRFYILVLNIVLLAASPVNTYGTEISAELIKDDLGTRYTISSQHLKEQRQLLVHLPDNYHESDKMYPVIYLLDGNSHFRHATVAATILQQNEMMPEAIIVAIPNNQGTRNRDLNIENNNFIGFIKEEAMGFISGKFRTTSHKTLFGHSSAGNFTLFILRSEYMNLFDNYIAASPAISMSSVRKFEQQFKNKKKFNKSLYFTLGGFDAEKQFIQPETVNNYIALLKKMAPKDFIWNYDSLPEQTHMTTPYITLYRGLSRVFSDYEVK